MAPAALDNANPTVLNASELPTRKQKVIPRRGPDSKYADVIFARPPYLSSPFCGDDYGAAIAWPRGGAGADDGGLFDDASPEPIDEQEIYDLISTITDPEHPVSLGQLSVINLADIRMTPSPRAGEVPDPNTLVEVTGDELQSLETKGAAAAS
ncbi:hypothetical protein LLEC1_01502 [Akanthomyces lecanii]|uniref:Uncharacterized protein n=1 Tax=Cordyceps confragosa TaxID=2714763 RepID=A0A179I9L1_CORDF|nr:hypothetical protein LLEC1_01502 [Akanthomyces lecanii]